MLFLRSVKYFTTETKISNNQKSFSKTKIIVAFTACICLLNINESISQFTLNENIYPASLSTNTGVYADTNAFNLNNVAKNIKVQRSFISYFGENTENHWSRVGKNFYNRFHINGLHAYVLFAKNGKLIYVITSGAEKILSADVRKIVKSEYYYYSIRVVIEVKQDNRDIWVVKLDNASQLMTVRVEDGEMERVQ
jgi:hypothetical protein